MDRFYLDRLRIDSMKTQNKKRITSEQGFTVVEIIIAMAMSLVVMGAIYSLFQTQQKSYIHQERVATIQQNLRGAMYIMTREIRLAGCNPRGISPAPGIFTADANTIQVTMDITNAAGTGSPDGLINNGPSNEDVTYDLVGTNLRRNNQVVAEYISSLTFTYLDEDGDGTNESVQVNIVAQTQKGQITSRSLTSNIKCRNLSL